MFQAGCEEGFPSAGYLIFARYFFGEASNVSLQSLQQVPTTMVEVSPEATFLWLIGHVPSLASATTVR